MSSMRVGLAAAAALAASAMGVNQAAAGCCAPWNWGGCCTSYATSYTYVQPAPVIYAQPVVQVAPVVVQQPSVYVVNQGPYYSGYGLTDYAPSVYYAPQAAPAYPYVSGYPAYQTYPPYYRRYPAYRSYRTSWRWQQRYYRHHRDHHRRHWR